MEFLVYMAGIGFCCISIMGCVNLWWTYTKSGLRFYEWFDGLGGQ